MERGGQSDFRGPLVHGRRGERLIYLTWGARRRRPVRDVLACQAEDRGVLHTGPMTELSWSRPIRLSPVRGSLCALPGWMTLRPSLKRAVIPTLPLHGHAVRLCRQASRGVLLARSAPARPWTRGRGTRSGHPVGLPRPTSGAGAAGHASGQRGFAEGGRARWVHQGGRAPCLGAGRRRAARCRHVEPGRNGPGLISSRHRSGEDERGSIVLETTQRCLPIIRSRVKPRWSNVDKAPWNRNPAGTASAGSG